MHICPIDEITGFGVEANRSRVGAAGVFYRVSAAGCRRAGRDQDELPAPGGRFRSSKDRCGVVPEAARVRRWLGLNVDFSTTAEVTEIILTLLRKLNCPPVYLPEVTPPTELIPHITGNFHFPSPVQNALRGYIESLEE